MKVILKETINALGIIGSEVIVADGYARNYLFPQNKAVKSTAMNQKILEQEKVKVDLQIAKERKIAEEMAERLEGIECRITARVSEGDRLYGSITVRDIINAMAEQDVKVEKRMVLLKEPIKTIGIHKIPIRVYNEVEPEISVEIVPE